MDVFSEESIYFSRIAVTRSAISTFSFCEIGILQEKCFPLQFSRRVFPFLDKLVSERNYKLLISAWVLCWWAYFFFCEGQSKSNCRWSLRLMCIGPNKSDLLCISLTNLTGNWHLCSLKRIFKWQASILSSSIMWTSVIFWQFWRNMRGCNTSPVRRKKNHLLILFYLLQMLYIFYNFICWFYFICWARIIWPRIFHWQLWK